MTIITLILGFLVGFGKAVHQTIEHHWERSTFRKCLANHPECYKWMASKEKSSVPMWLWFLYDGKHFFETVMHSGYGLMIVAAWYFTVSGVHIVLFFVVVILTFVYLYKFAFLGVK